MRRSLKAVIAFLITSVMTVSASAQRYAGDSRSYFDFGEQFYSSAVQSPDGRTLDIRITNAAALISFVRSATPAQRARGEYYAVRDINAELDQHGVSQPIANVSLRDTVFAQTFEQTNAKNHWFPVNVKLQLPKLDTTKSYTLRVEMRDAILNKLAVRPAVNEMRIRQFDPFATNNSAIGLADIILFDSVRSDKAYTSAYGRTFPFSHDINGAVLLALPKNTDPSQTLTTIKLIQVSSVPDAKDTMNEVRSTITVPNSMYIKGQQYQIAAMDSIITYALRPAEAAGEAQYVTVPFTIPGQMLDQGKYQLQVTVGNGAYTRSDVDELTLNWPDRPLTLEDPRDAIAPLVHLTTEDEYRDLQKGQKQDLIRKLYQFWKKQDPTPGTAFNERMATFYQRADYADFNFAVGKMLDGAMTDRGKVYLLYGPPTKIERSLLPGEDPVETWTYTNNVKKTFRFTDASGRGEYKLAEVKPN